MPDPAHHALALNATGPDEARGGHHLPAVDVLCHSLSCLRLRGHSIDRPHLVAVLIALRLLEAEQLRLSHPAVEIDGAALACPLTQLQHQRPRLAGPVAAHGVGTPAG